MIGGKRVSYISIKKLLDQKINHRDENQDNDSQKNNGSHYVLERLDKRIIEIEDCGDLINCSRETPVFPKDTMARLNCSTVLPRNSKRKEVRLKSDLTVLINP